MRDAPIQLIGLPGWTVVQGGNNIVLAKSISSENSSGVITLFSLVVDNFKWHVIYTHDSPVPVDCPVLAGVPSSISSISDILEIVKVVDGAKICLGNNNCKYRQLKEWDIGKFYDRKSQ